MSINLVLLAITGHDGSMCNADQYGSMCDQILSTDTDAGSNA